MPNRERVFPYSTDQALGQIGSALDFIAEDQAKAAAQQREMDFQSEEKRKERDFTASENQKTAQRRNRADAALNHIKTLREMGTPNAMKAADEAEAAFLRDPDSVLAFQGSESVGVPYATIDKSLLRFLPKKEFYSNSDIQEAVKQRTQIEQSNIAAADKDRDQFQNIYKEIERSIGYSSNIAAQILANGYPAGVAPDGKTQLYDTTYSPHATAVLKELEALRAEVAAEQATGNPPSQALIEKIGKMRDPYTAIKESREASNRQWQQQEIVKLEADASGIEAEVKKNRELATRTAAEIAELKKQLMRSHRDFSSAKKISRLRSEIDAKEKILKTARERIEKYQAAATDRRGRILTRKSVLNKIGGAPATDPFNLKSVLDAGVAK